MTTATQQQLRRGTATQHATFTGAQGEVTVDTTNFRAIVHDGVTAGGKPQATEAFVAAAIAALTSGGAANFVQWATCS